ncbi:MAG: thiamine diphosphokinase [bacterium]|nr:thiamine diphosphokinase [bacterium]
MSKKALIFANGDRNDGPMVRRALTAAGDALIVAADGGARVAQAFGYRVAVIVGDMDSLTGEELDAVLANGAEALRHPPEKDATDLELALNVVAERGIDWIRIIGGVGDRIDQTLGNIYLLALPLLAGRDVRLMAGKQETRLLHPGEHHISGTAGDTISLIPLGGAVQGIITDGLYYPLKDEPLLFGPARGISNVMTGDAATVTFRDGLLLLVHTVGRA